MTDWFPEAIIDRGNDSGEYTDLGEPKGLLHTTEGRTYAGARQAYALNNSWPHATCSYEGSRFRIWQHVPLSKPSRALRNESGGVQTNRDNVIQLEIVGTADRHNAASWGPQYVENFPKVYLDGIARWMRFVEANRRVPRRCTLSFKRYPESYGANNGIRLSGAQWDVYSGWLGHQHAPENTHGDPGLINIAYLLASQEEDMPLDAADISKIAAVVKANNDDAAQAVWSVAIPRVSDGGDSPARAHLRWANHNAGIAAAQGTQAVAELAALQAAVAQLGAGGDIDYGRVQEAAEAAVRAVAADAATPDS